MQEYLDFAKAMAVYAGEVMKEYFFKDKGVEYKEDRTPVTVADKKINDYVIDMVRKTYPNHSVDGEEAQSKTESNYVWVCDPIDGTSMFTRGIPIAVFSLALVIDGVPTVGVVYDPFLDRMYTAIKGEGAYCNGDKLSVNGKKYGDLGCSVDYNIWNGAKYDVLKIVKEILADVKTSELGSVAHACMLLAEGSISASIFPGSDHGHCDMAASKLIVEEAGGKVTNFHGEEQRYDRSIDGTIATNGVMHEELMKRVRRALSDE